jgi:hypothetical protein
MGTTESLHLAIYVETHNVQAGCEVTGVIHFRPHWGIQAKSLQLKLTGKEEWFLDDKLKGKREIVKRIFSICVFERGKVVAGDYRFPFRIATSDTLPGSFVYTRGAIKAQVRYSVTAQMQSPGVKVRRAKMPIRVNSHMTEAIVGMKETVTTYTCSWWCFRAGAVRANVQISKSAYVPGELSYVTVEIDNSRSGRDVIGLKGYLTRTIRLKGDQGPDRIIKETINSWGLTARVPAGRVASGSSALQLALAVQDATGTMENTPSLLEHHIQCLYSLTIEVLLDGKGCGEPLIVRRNVTVYQVQMPTAVPLLPPTGWSPEVLPLVQVLTPSSYKPDRH